MKRQGKPMEPMPGQNQRARETGGRLEALERLAGELGTTPGWIDREAPIFWPEPRSAFHPAHWSYAKVRDALVEAAGVVDLSLAERRILALRNPCPGNNFATTRTLSLSYQLMLPGEIASTHRHAPHALRVMLDARGTYSVADGVRMPMETGDVVLTPGQSWHGHGHDGDAPAIWVDVLDIPLTHLLEPMSFEAYPGRHMPAEATVEVSPFRFPATLLARRLEAERRIVLETPGMTTIGLAIERLVAGDVTQRQRSTASRAVVAMAGAGLARIGDLTFGWEAGDCFAVPSWTWYEIEAEEAARLVEVSDEPVMRFCGYWRQETA